MDLTRVVNNVETIDLTFSPPPVRIDLSGDIDVDPSDDVILISPQPLRSRPNPPLLTTIYPGPPSSIVPDIFNRSGSKRPAETIILDDAAPPSKKARDMSLPVPSKQLSRINTPSPTRQASAKREVIVLDSDGEQTIFVKQKKFKREETVSSDEGSDYDRIHAGYDLANSRIWKPCPTNENRLEQEFIDTIQKLAVTPAPSHRRYTNISDKSVTNQVFSDPTFIWEQLRQVPLLARYYPPKSVRQTLLPPGSHGRKVTRSTTTPQFRCQTTFKDAPGSINKIVQSGPWVGICSAVVDGHPDRPGDRENPRNREGSAMIWNESAQILSGHYRNRSRYTKHYTVNDIKPDPTSSSFVSSGNDGEVIVWNREPDDDTFTSGHTWQFKKTPHDLAFKPGESILAVAERRLYIFPDLSLNGTELHFSIVGKRFNHCVGAMAWGTDTTSKLLFASSEPPPGSELTGYHKAFDIGKQDVAYEFDANEAGDAMCVSPDGSKFALLTRGNDQTHLLRLYDVARGLYNKGMTTKLEPFPSDIEGEVNNAAFSPDGIFLALGRNDNHTHVYDSRMLDRLLFDYEHHGPSRVSPGSESYGIVQVQWVDGSSKRLPAGLYTGGNDGCVRFWDPLRSARDPINSRILVESSFDVGYFSIGDYHSGERDIIIGDCAGEVSVFEMRCWGA